MKEVVVRWGNNSVVNPSRKLLFLLASNVLVVSLLRDGRHELSTAQRKPVEEWLESFRRYGYDY